MPTRNYNRIDRIIIGLSRALEGLGAAPRAAKAFPADAEDNDALDDQDRRRAARYMRVNHTGEICAQALYHGQAMTARDSQVRARMKQAAEEEHDHLAWCAQRIDELKGRRSLLNPFWHLGAFAIGGIVGAAGDRWNLGFVAETERQVVDHLDAHLGKLPENDTRSRAVITQMQQDERQHANAALEAGAVELPRSLKCLMRLAAKVMTSTAHWV